MTVSTLLLVLLVLPSSAPASDAPVILDFTATWCGPCQQMKPALAALSRKGYPVRPVDIDRQPDLAAKYGVTEVPTFIIVDPDGRVLARTKSTQPAADLARLYLKARARFEESRAESDPEPAPPAEEVADAIAEEVASDPSTNRRRVPAPWQTGVRIKIFDGQAVGLGSGTVIYSTPEESIILTCAHIFKEVGGAAQYPAAKFPHKIVVDLFDGNPSGSWPPVLHPVESVAGRAIDYDFNTDVGLIRIRPGRRLPASPVVPVAWKPAVGLRMKTVGCSEGRDATAWSTSITSTRVTGLADQSGRPIRNYEAIQCGDPPRKGRSGGGLYTNDGYVAGVCNFQEPRGGFGLYATPRSIYRMLDRNALTVCYKPDAPSRETLLARTSRPGGATKLRAQNAEVKRITVPAPGLVGADLPSKAPGSKGAFSADGWKAPAHREARSPTPREEILAALERGESPQRPGSSAVATETDMEMDPSTQDDPDFSAIHEADASPAPRPAPKSRGWRASRGFPRSSAVMDR